MPPSVRSARALMNPGIVLLFLCLSGPATGAERFELKESRPEGEVVKTTAALAVEGKLYPTPGPDNALKLAVEAHFDFDERRLAGVGRDALAQRSVRYYREAAARIDAGGQYSNVSLRNELRLIVAQGQTAGLELFSPSGPLTFGELELLRVPGDSLLSRALLPDSKVEVGEKWTPDEWVLPLLTGIEAAEKTELSCRLEGVRDKVARIAVQGEVTGAVLGAAATIEVTGTLSFNLESKLLTTIELTQTEKRSIGPVSPGLDLTAKIKVERAEAAGPKRLTDQDLANVSLEANDASKLLMFDAPAWNVQFFHDRHWHLFHQSSETAILRLLDKGGLISQCNIRQLPAAKPGEHISEDQFHTDIQRTLGKQFQQIVQSEKVKLRDGLFVLRVTAVGAVERKNEKNEPVVTPMQWNYYLVANADGRQVAFVFSVNPKLAEELDGRDVQIVGGLEFLAPKSKLTPASARGN